MMANMDNFFILSPIHSVIHWQADFVTCAEPRHARGVLIVGTVAIWYCVKVDARTVSVSMMESKCTSDRLVTQLFMSEVEEQELQRYRSTCRRHIT